MLSLIFVILMFTVIGKLIVFSIKAAWSITKVVLTIVFFPAILIIMAVSGFMMLAVIALVIAGIISIFVPMIV
ncbi:MAG: hypothetical protein Q4D29_04960 [Lachnospiraceae bacterium]|nr:hypothetical protein [Lachnospiraceae bacterium]